jgi:hypothetical protein
MTHAAIQVGERTFTVSFDDEQPRGRRTTVIVRGRAVDELTGEPIEASLTVEPAGAAFARNSSRMLVGPRRSAGGVVGLVGVPLLALPQVDTQSYEVGLRVAAAGYHALVARVNHGPIAGPLGTWQPADLGDLLLHGAATHVAGRVVAEGTPRTPIAGAQVRVAQAWRTLPTPTTVPAPIASRLLSVSPPLYAPRTAASDTADETVLTAVAGQDKQLREGPGAGTTEVWLSDGVGLGPGTLLRFEPTDPDRAEVIPVGLVDGAAAPSANPALPAVVTLGHPLAFSHRQRIAVEVVAEAPGAQHNLDVDAEPGDRSLMLATLGALGAVAWIRIAGGAAPEYHRPALLEVATDTEGFYRLPAIDRLATIRLEAVAPGLGPSVHDLRLEPGVPERSVGFVLS